MKIIIKRNCYWTLTQSSLNSRSRVLCSMHLAIWMRLILMILVSRIINLSFLNIFYIWKIWRHLIFYTFFLHLIQGSFLRLDSYYLVRLIVVVSQWSRNIIERTRDRIHFKGLQSTSTLYILFDRIFKAHFYLTFFMLFTWMLFWIFTITFTTTFINTFLNAISWN